MEFTNGSEPPEGQVLQAFRQEFSYAYTHTHTEAHKDG